MDRSEMAFEGIKAGIFDWIKTAREEARDDLANGWNADEILNEMDETWADLGEEIEALEFYLDEDTRSDLDYYMDQARKNLEDYILNELKAP